MTVDIRMYTIVCPIIVLLLHSIEHEELRRRSDPALAGALYAGKPIEEPQAKRGGNVKNHLADFDLDVTVWSGCRCHRVSSSWWE